MKNKWVLLVVTLVLALGVKHYLGDGSNYSHYARTIYQYISGSDSSPRSYVQVAKISHRAEKRGGNWYATIYITVKNVSEKTVTALSGNLKYTAGRPQTATIQYSGKIPPGGREKITLFAEQSPARADCSADSRCTSIKSKSSKSGLKGGTSQPLS